MQVPPAIHPAVPAIAGTAALRFNACIAPLPPTAYPPPMILAVTVPAPATMHTATASVIVTGTLCSSSGICDIMATIFIPQPLQKGFSNLGLVAM